MSQDIERREFLKYLLTSGVALTTAGSVGGLLNGCENSEEVVVERTYDFLAHLGQAEIMTPHEGYVARIYFSAGGDKREVLFEHPDSRVTFRGVSIFKKARLVFGIGIGDHTWGEHGDGVLFEVMLTDEKNRQRVLYSRYIDPKNVPDHRQWFDESVVLDQYEGEQVSFVFKTSAGPNKDNTFDWAGWSSPKIVYEEVIHAKRIKHKNVLLISVDTLRADHLGCCGHPRNLSPTLDRLARTGVLFKNAVAQATVTLPSHMSILTSLYPSVHSISPRGKFAEVKVALSLAHVTLAEILKKENYQTSAFVDGGWLSRKFGYDQGFNLYDDEGGHIAAIGEKVRGFLQEHFQEKFFLFMHVYDVHGPYEPPSPYRRLYYKGNEFDPANHSMDFIREVGYHQYHKFGDVRDINYVKGLYAGGVTYVDHELGRIFALMEQLKIFDNTLIVLLSDHGESLFEHHVYIGHGMFLYDTEARIPLIVKLPQNKWADRVVADQVQSIDVVPTILDVLDLPKLPEAQGRSLLEYMEKPALVRRNNDAFGETPNLPGTFFVRTNRWKYISPFTLSTQEISETLRCSDQVDLAQYIITDEQLYDLYNDPGEIENVIEKEPALAAEFRAKLMQWKEENQRAVNEFRQQRQGQSQKSAGVPLSTEEKEALRALGYIE